MHVIIGMTDQENGSKILGKTDDQQIGKAGELQEVFKEISDFPASWQIFQLSGSEQK